MATTTLLTIDDFERLPDEQAKDHELVDGELIDVSERTLGHNQLRDHLLVLLAQIVSDHGLGEVIAEQDYDFAGNAHGPDVTFVGNAKASLIDPAKRVQPFVPDFAIEIASENDTWNGIMRKRQRYLACGTREVWIIEPESAEIFIFAERGNRILKGNDVIETDLIPGFSITIAELLG